MVGEGLPAPYLTSSCHIKANLTGIGSFFLFRKRRVLPRPFDFGEEVSNPNHQHIHIKSICRTNTVFPKLPCPVFQRVGHFWASLKKAWASSHHLLRCKNPITLSLVVQCSTAIVSNPSARSSRASRAWICSLSAISLPRFRATHSSLVIVFPFYPALSPLWSRMTHRDGAGGGEV